MKFISLFSNSVIQCCWQWRWRIYTEKNWTTHGSTGSKWIRMMKMRMKSPKKIPIVLEIHSWSHHFIFVFLHPLKMRNCYEQTTTTTNMRWRKVEKKWHESFRNISSRILFLWKHSEMRTSVVMKWEEDNNKKK